jgi:ubiquinone/menaquinone biosynthesis C-methylase UbiE
VQPFLWPGCGPGNLAVAIARITNCDVYAMDFSAPMTEIASAKIRQEDLDGRVRAVAGDVHRLPFRATTVNLVVSRGSLRFWRNRPEAIREIKRIMTAGGKCYIGGGLGLQELAQQVSQKMKECDFADWTDKPHGYKGRSSRTEWEGILLKAGILHYEITRDDSGFWIYFGKE